MTRAGYAALRVTRNGFARMLENVKARLEGHRWRWTNVHRERLLSRKRLRKNQRHTFHRAQRNSHTGDRGNRSLMRCCAELAYTRRARVQCLRGDLSAPVARARFTE